MKIVKSSSTLKQKMASVPNQKAQKKTERPEKWTRKIRSP